MASPLEWAESILQRAQAKSLGGNEVFGELTDLLQSQNQSFFSLKKLLSTLVKNKSSLNVNLKGSNRNIPLDLKGMVVLKKASDKISKKIQLETKSSAKKIEAAEKKMGLLSTPALKKKDKSPKEVPGKTINPKKGIEDIKKDINIPSTEIPLDIDTTKASKELEDIKKDINIPSTEIPLDIDTKNISKKSNDFKKIISDISSEIIEATQNEDFDLVGKLINKKKVVEVKQTMSGLFTELKKSTKLGDTGESLRLNDELSEAKKQLDILDTTFSEGLKKSLLDKDYSLSKRLLNKKEAQGIKESIQSLNNELNLAFDKGDVEGIKRYAGELRQARTRLMELRGGFKKLKAVGRRSMDLLSTKMGQFISTGVGVAAITKGFSDLTIHAENYAKQQFLLNTSVGAYENTGITSSLSRSADQYGRVIKESATLTAMSFKLGASLGELEGIQEQLRDRIRNFGKTAAVASAQLAEMTEQAFVASKVLGIDSSKAVDIIERRMWKFGISSEKAGDNLFQFREMAMQTNRTLGKGSLRMEDFVSIMDDASSSTTSYAQNTRFLGTIVRQHIERVQMLGSTYQESIESAKELTKTLTTDTPELVKYQAGKIILDTVKIAQDKIFKTLGDQRKLTKEEQKALGTNAKFAGELSDKEKKRLANLLALRQGGARDLQHAKKIADSAASIPSSLQRQQFIQQEIGESAAGQMATMTAITDMNLGTWIQVAVASGKSVKSAVEQYHTAQDALKLAKERKVEAGKELQQEESIRKIRLEAIRKQAGGDKEKFSRLKAQFDAESLLVKKRLDQAKEVGDEQSLREASIFKLARSFGSKREKEEREDYIKTAMLKRKLTRKDAEKEIEGIVKLNEKREEETEKAKQQRADLEKSLKELGEDANDTEKAGIQDEIDRLDQQIKSRSLDMVLDITTEKAKEDVSNFKLLTNYLKNAFGLLESPLIQIAGGIGLLVAQIVTSSLQLSAMRATVAQGSIRNRLLTKIALQKGLGGGGGSLDEALGGGGKKKGFFSRAGSKIKKFSGTKLGKGAIVAALAAGAFSLFSSDAEASEEPKKSVRPKSTQPPLPKTTDILKEVKKKGDVLKSVSKKKDKGFFASLRDGATDILTSGPAQVAAMALMFAPVPGSRVLAAGLKAFQIANITAEVAKGVGLTGTNVATKLPQKLKEELSPAKDTVLKSLSASRVSLPTASEGISVSDSIKPTGATAPGQSPKAIGIVKGMTPSGALKLEIPNFKDVLGLVNRENTTYS